MSGETAILVPRGGRAWIESPPSKDSPVEWPLLLVGIVLVAIKIVVMTSKRPVWLTLRKEEERGDE